MLTIALPFDQEYDVPPEAAKEIDVFEHVNIELNGGAIVATGATMFWLIVCEAVAVQPFAAVTVTV